MCWGEVRWGVNSWKIFPRSCNWACTLMNPCCGGWKISVGRLLLINLLGNTTNPISSHTPASIIADTSTKPYADISDMLVDFRSFLLVCEGRGHLLWYMRFYSLLMKALFRKPANFWAWIETEIRWRDHRVQPLHRYQEYGWLGKGGNTYMKSSVLWGWRKEIKL